MSARPEPVVTLLPAHSARFAAARIQYGGVRGEHDFPEVQRPIVVFGPGGSGKSTFIEALVRGVYGFNPRNRTDQARLAERSPWNAATYRTEITLESDGTLWTIERDFVSMELVLRRGGGESRPGPAEVTALGPDSTETIDRIEALIGLRDLESYTETAVLHQGSVEETRLGTHLLRIASGGNAPVDRAKERIQEAHLAIAGAPVGGGEPGVLQRLEGELHELHAGIERARAAEDRRGPIIQEIDSLQEALDAVEAETGILRQAHGVLADRRALDAELDRVRQRLEILTELEAEWDEARKADAEAQAEWDRITRDGELPEDLPERLARLEPLLMARSEIDQVLEHPGPKPPPGSWVWGGATLVLAGVAAGIIALIESVVPIGIAAAALLLAGLFLLGVHWRQRTRFRRAAAERDRLTERRSEIEPEIAGLAAPIGSGEPPGPTRHPALRERFERERSLRTTLERVKERRAELRRRTVRTFAEQEPADGAQAEDRMQARVRAAAAEARKSERELAARRAELTADALGLPAGVEAETEAIDRALATRQERARSLSAALAEERQRLLEEGSPPLPSLVLAHRAAGVDRVLASRRDRAAAYERAHALLEDAYEAFRARDQDRLVSRVSERIAALSRGALGPVEVHGSLSDATIRIGERSGLIDSPPLSWGQLHTVTLGIRLGVIDFLSSAGVAPPLLADDPFAHLDDDRIEALWALLHEVSAERQVVVTVHSERLLEELGVDPDIVLE